MINSRHLIRSYYDPAMTFCTNYSFHSPPLSLSLFTWWIMIYNRVIYYNEAAEEEA